MEEELLSKKELLDLTGISYGQLYRWKRKNLIPEEWFIRKSTFTGQETFFPKTKILARIEKIMNMKDDLSLDDIADMFSPSPSFVALAADEAVKRGIVHESTLETLSGRFSLPQKIAFQELLYLSIVQLLLQQGSIGLTEAATVYAVLQEHYPKFQGRACELICTRKMGIFSCQLAAFPSEIYFDDEVRIVATQNVATSVEALKEKLG